MRRFLLAGSLFCLANFSLLAEDANITDSTKLPSGPLTLKDAEALAIANNRDIGAARLNLTQAREEYLAQIGGWLPSVSGLAYSARTQKDQGISHFWNASALTMTQQLVSVPLYEQVKLAKLSYDTSKYALAGLINDVLLKVRQSYYQVILDLMQIKVQKAHIELFGALVKEQQNRLKLGTSSDYDVKQTQVALANTLPAYYTYIQQWRVDQNAFAQLLNVSSDEAQNIVLADQEIPVLSIPLLVQKIDMVASCHRDSLKDPDLSEEIVFQDCRLNQAFTAPVFSTDELKEWNDIAMQYRPALLQAANNIDIAQNGVQTAKSTYYPTVQAVANYGSSNLIYTLWSSHAFAQTYEWEGHVQLSWNLFNGFTREHEVRKARAGRQGARLLYEQQYLATTSDIRDKLFNIQQSIFAFLSANSSVEISRDSIEDAKNRLNLGVIRILDYRTVVDDFSKAATTLNLSRYYLISAYYELRHAIGIDINYNEITPSSCY
ncbi:MAG: TolC family protein [Parachlamydiales bacterium]|nr:TolC family protein [Parachlamydiales bacterium]